MFRVSLLIFCAGLAQGLAQMQATGAVSGVVREMGSGTPIVGAKVGVSGDPGLAKGKEVTTDGNGRYTLPDVSPGQHRITAQAPPKPGDFPRTSSRSVTVAAGQRVDGIDFGLRTRVSLSGHVYDQNKEPMAGVSVFLIAREYSYGALRYVFSFVATTNDEGEYVLNRIEPGRGYLVMAAKRPQKRSAISEAPADPKLRKPAFVPTYYPGTTSLEGAQPVTLRAGEHREGVDLKVHRSTSFCIEGQLQGLNGPEELQFTLADRQPSSGWSGGGGMFMGSPLGTTGLDGKFRICDLYPGEHRLTVHSKVQGMPAFWGIADIPILDRDISRVTVAPTPPVTIPGEIVWAGEPPETPVEKEVGLFLRPLTRAPWTGERTDVKSKIPGNFSIPNVLADAYVLDFRGLPSDLYIKEATYAGRSVLAEPLHPGSAVGEAALRIVVARDGGTVAAKVMTKDAPAADARVLIIPAAVSSEAALPAAIIAGQCDQNGMWTSSRLAPGKYYATALAAPHDNSPESIGALWRNRTQMKEIEVTAKGEAQVTIPLSGN